MSVGRQELILPVDWDIIDACNGFTFDMGGSVMKIVFVDKNDWVEQSHRKHGSKGNLHMVTFPRSEVHLAMDFILDRVRIPRPQDGTRPRIYSSGYGATEYSQAITEKLGVTNVQLMETDCFIYSFMYLVKNLPRKEVLHPIYKPAYQSIFTKMEVMSNMMETMRGLSQSVDTVIDGIKSLQNNNGYTRFPPDQLEEGDPEKPLTSEDDLFPCGVMLCGSGFAFAKIASDGCCSMLRTWGSGGKTFLGLGSLLTGTDSFEELMDLCEKGNQFNVSLSHQGMYEDIQSTGDNDFYGKWGAFVKSTPEELAHCYGKAHGKRIGDFKREDLARNLLETHVYDLALLIRPAAASHNLKHVFFAGGFVSHPLVRRVITEQWLIVGQDAANMDPIVKREVQIHFLVHAQSLGALGAMLNHKFKWIEKHQKRTTCSSKEG